MRDIVVVSVVLIGALHALRRPWIGILVWTWLSIMNPHRYTYGFAFNAPLAQLTAVCTLIGLLITSEKRSPFYGGSAPAFLFAFTLWISLSWLMGLDPDGDREQWSKVMKINFMFFVALALIRSKLNIVMLIWVAAGSLALLGAKGGVFTILHGGSERVWGPPGSFIEDNNEFACALVMTIPLLRFLQLQCHGKWLKRIMLLSMVLCAASALGSQSRGALLAIVSMSLMLWIRSKGNRAAAGVAILVVGVALIAFMPDTWTSRMQTIETYETDGSAMGRISAWWNAWNLAFHYPFGVGFNTVRAELFALYSPYPHLIQAAHSIYFLVLGNHGFIGLFIYLGIWVASWRTASWLRKNAHSIPQAVWAADLGSYAQVAFVGFGVGGAFLSLSYFDLPYVVMVSLVAAKSWVQSKGWETDRPLTSKLLTRLGAGTAAVVPKG